jgi:outer membrane lipoprotein-sorting protein
VIASLVLVAVCLAQTPDPVSPREPQANADEKLARETFAALREGRRDFRHLTAEYEQHRTTTLSRKPIVSSGQMSFRSDPGCLAFVVAKPKPARILLDEKRYQVYRPDTKQMERFLLDDARLSRALFDALAGRWSDLDAGFRLQSVARDAEQPRRVTIAFTPRDPDAKRTVAALSIVALLPDAGAPTPAAAELEQVGYVDAQGDRVEIRLREIRLDGPLAEDVFVVEPPPGTKLLEHRARKPAPTPAPRVPRGDRDGR